MEVLEATVKGHESLMWNGHAADVLVVVYQSDSGSTFGATRTPRGRLWVAHDGTVLRQEMWIFGSRLWFDRLPPDAAAERTAGLDETLTIRTGDGAAP